MSIKTQFINKRTMKKVNAALVAAGYLPYPGDRTTAQPNGSGSGYVSNLIDWMNPASYSERQKIERIVASEL